MKKGLPPCCAAPKEEDFFKLFLNTLARKTSTLLILVQLFWQKYTQKAEKIAIKRLFYQKRSLFEAVPKLIWYQIS